MTEKSYMWTHGVGGDASYSPYDASEFNLYHFLPLVGDGINTTYVVPGYLNDLEVQSPNNGLGASSFFGVVVKPGAALLNNYLYLLDETKTLIIRKPSAGYVRRDIVVLRYTNINNKPKIRLGVVEGTDSLADNAATPALTQTLVTYEVALAIITVNGNAVSIYGNYIEDRRRFIYNMYCKKMFGGFKGNLIQNSEFLGNSYDGTASQGPDHWVPTGTTLNTRTAMSVGSGRGNWGYNLDTGDGGIKQFIPAGRYRTFTLSLYYSKVNSNNDFSISVSGYGADGLLKKQKMVSLQDQPASEAAQYFQWTFTFDEEIDLLYLLISSGATTTIVQPILVPGYHPGNYRPVQEVVMFQIEVTDANWLASAKSTGTTTIDLTASFGTFIKSYTRAIILRLRGRDSGSAAAASCYLRALGYAAPYNSVYGSLELEGVTNDVWREIHCIVPIDQIYYVTGAGIRFRLEVLATGVGTFDATASIVGIII